MTEEDARAFLVLREGLANHGVTLLDAIVFHEDHRWWSLHELTSGTTQWSDDDVRLFVGHGLLVRYIAVFARLEHDGSVAAFWVSLDMPDPASD